MFNSSTFKSDMSCNVTNHNSDGMEYVCYVVLDMRINFTTLLQQSTISH